MIPDDIAPMWQMNQLRYYVARYAKPYVAESFVYCILIGYDPCAEACYGPFESREDASRMLLALAQKTAPLEAGLK